MGVYHDAGDDCKTIRGFADLLRLTLAAATADESDASLIIRFLLHRVMKEEMEDYLMAENG